MKIKKVLITGACGFVGRNTALYFANAGWEVMGVGHSNWVGENWQHWGISNWRSMDLQVEQLAKYCKSADVIVHCAGSGSVGFSMEYPLEDFRRTVDSTIEVLEFARKYSPHSVVIYPSSGGVYGIADKLPMSESDPVSPASPYGVHKRIAEELCISYGNTYDLSVAVVRLFSVYGIGMKKQLLWDACKAIQNNSYSFFGTGAESRDWINIQDASSLLFEASKWANPTCPIINGGSGIRTTVSDVLGELFISFGIAEKPTFTGSLRIGDPAHYQADTQKLKALGWEPKTNWRDGVNQYAKWFASIDK